MTEMVPQQKQLKTVQSLLNNAQFQSMILAALPRFLKERALQFLRIAFTSIQRNPVLAQCEQRSLLGAIMQAAELGLTLDSVLGHAYLVPFKEDDVRKAQLIPGYKGLINLARRSGELVNFYAYPVWDGDIFEVELGDTPSLKHKPKLEARPHGKESDIKKRLEFVYACSHFKGASPGFDVMTIGEVERIRARSKARDNGPWVTDYEAMALKTVIRRHSKLLPMAIEFQTAVTLDETHEAGIEQNLGALIDLDIDAMKAEEPKPETPTVGKLDRISEKLESKKGKAAEQTAEEKEISSIQGHIMKEIELTKLKMPGEINSYLFNQTAFGDVDEVLKSKDKEKLLAALTALESARKQKGGLFT